MQKIPLSVPASSYYTLSRLLEMTLQRIGKKEITMISYLASPLYAGYETPIVETRRNEIARTGVRTLPDYNFCMLGKSIGRIFPG